MMTLFDYYQIMKSETSRISHEQQAMKEKIKVNQFKFYDNYYKL